MTLVFLSTLLAMHILWFLMFQRVNLSVWNKMAIKEKEFTCASTIEVADAKIEEVISSPTSTTSTTYSSGNESLREHSD